MNLAGEVSVMEAEATGMLEAIKWIETKDLCNVVIESDSQLVVHVVMNSVDYQLEIGYILDECREKLIKRSDLSVSHVKKLANKAAHFMARVPCLLNNYNCFTSPPELLLEMIPFGFQLE